MKDRTHRAIINAMDLLATGRSANTNGKVTAVNVAKEAGIGKATLYRYFEEHADLRQAYDAMRKNGIRLVDEVPETIQQAYRMLKDEVKRLRTELAEARRIADQGNELKAHQIQLLWTDNERLKKQVSRLQNSGTVAGNVVPLNAPKT